MITAEQGQALAPEVSEITLLSIRLALGDEDFRILQAHVHRGVRHILPAPLGVLENRHVDPALLEIIEAARDRRRHQYELVVGLRLVQGLHHLRQQAGVGAVFGTNGIRRKMRSTDPHQLRSLGRQRQENGQSSQHQTRGHPHRRKRQDNPLPKSPHQ
ncbi:hypothetical protein D3C81_1790900 [compost metagenome]